MKVYIGKVTPEVLNICKDRFLLFIAGKKRAVKCFIIPHVFFIVSSPCVFGDAIGTGACVLMGLHRCYYLVVLSYNIDGNDFRKWLEN